MPNDSVLMLGTIPGSRPMNPMKLRLIDGSSMSSFDADVAADLLRGDVDERRFGRHGDGFRDRPDLQRHVHRGGLPDLEPHVLARVFLEPLQLGGDLVHAGHEAADEVDALGGADRFAEHAVVLIAHDDRHAGQDGALRIDNLAAHFRRSLLRGRGGGHEQRQQHQAHYT